MVIAPARPMVLHDQRNNSSESFVD